MKIAIVGGRLQGLEAVYLARKAGWDAVVVDRDERAPAVGLAGESRCIDVSDSGRHGDLRKIIETVDFVVPASESIITLEVLAGLCDEVGVPMAYDSNAYAISSSKLGSDRLFSRAGVPVPRPWPHCPFPVLAKPSGGSGSEGVMVFHNFPQLERHFSGTLPPPGWVLQEYVEGPSYSIEIVGEPGNYYPLQVTDLHMDAGYDCKRVTAPSVLSRELRAEFGKIAVTLAGAVGLRGLMDVEVILHDGKLKVLEIDARLPSQTPAAVYLSSGINILDLWASFCMGKGKRLIPAKLKLLNEGGPRGVVYEHILVGGGVLQVSGENVVAIGGDFRLERDFFGADEAITDFDASAETWVATLMIVEGNLASAREKRDRVIADIQKQCHLEVYRDPSPEPFT